MGRFLKISNTAPEGGGGPEGAAAQIIIEVETLQGAIAIDPESESVQLAGLPVAGALGDLGAAEGGAPDGLLDLALAVPGAQPDDNSSIIVLFNGGGAGAFTIGGSVILPAGPQLTGIAVAGIDNDKFDDIVAIHAGGIGAADGGMLLLRNDGAGYSQGGLLTQFGGLTDPAAVKVGDLINQDGQPEVVIADAGNDSVLVFENVAAAAAGGSVLNPDPVIIPAGEASAPAALQLADIDNDKFDDIVLGKTGSDEIGVIRNLGGGDFIEQQSVQAGQQPRQVGTADFDKDGAVEVWAYNAGDGTADSDSISIIKNVAGELAGSVELQAGSPEENIIAVAAIDLDLDGDNDLALAGDGGIGVLRNDSTPGGAITLAPDEALSQAIAVVLLVGDADADGNADIVTIELGRPAAAAEAAGQGPPLTALGVLKVAAKAPACGSDLSGNGLIDSADLNLLLTAFGAHDGGDINGDGDTNSQDLNLLLAVFGSTCP